MEKAERQNTSFVWFILPLVPPGTRDKQPDDRYNFGFSTGILTRTLILMVMGIMEICGNISGYKN